MYAMIVLDHICDAKRMMEDRGELIHFLLLSPSASEDSLANFVGADLEVMKPTAEEKSPLLAFESTARNYKVVCKTE